MGLENIEKAVLSEAEAEGQGIVAEAKSLLAERLAVAKRELEERFAARKRQQMANLESEHNRELSAARTDARLAVLKEKTRVIEAAFAGALQKLAEIPEEHFLKLAKAWLQEVPSELSGQIAAGPREQKLLEGEFLKGINQGREGKLTLAQGDGPVGGGIRVLADKFEFDFTWAGRLADRKGALAPDVASIIFGKEGQ
jgi:vacuolar-type H+-ATPase subunit E/Vma4